MKWACEPPVTGGPKEQTKNSWSASSAPMTRSESQSVTSRWLQAAVSAGCLLRGYLLTGEGERTGGAAAAPPSLNMEHAKGGIWMGESQRRWWEGCVCEGIKRALLYTS